MKLYIGNLPRSITDAGLKELFGSVGMVTSATVITDWDSGRSCGFGFVEMAREAGQQAITKFSGHLIESRTLHVYEAVEKQPH